MRAQSHIGGSRLRQIGWLVVLGICAAAVAALAFRVNAIRSDVALAEREIIALEEATLLLETEFQTRASQQQLADWNALEFGYGAPQASQFLENERQLAGLGTARGINAPDPIRVARAPLEEDGGIFPAMVSPMTGKPAKPAPAEKRASAAPAQQSQRTDKPASQLPLAERLAFAEAFPSPEKLATDLPMEASE